MKKLPPVLTEPHPGPWTEVEFFAMQEDDEYSGLGVELFDGCVLLGPAVSPRHRQIVSRLANLLEAPASPDLEVIHQINLRVAPSNIFVPDIVVTRQQGDFHVCDPEHVALVAEVVTPHGGGQETMLKHAMYEEAGIPRYLMVDGHHGGGELVASLHVLREGAYVEAGRACAGEVLRIDRPRLELDPADLLRRV